MATLQVTDLSVCTDCTQIIVNDEDSAMPDGHVWCRSRFSTYAKCQNCDLTTVDGVGMDTVCPASATAHRARMGEHMAQIEGHWIVDSDDHDDHSTVPCDACGTTLHGERYAAVVLA